MKLKLLGLSLLLGAVAAYAATVNVSWTNATKNTDDSSIPSSGPGSIASTRVEIGTCNGTAFGTKVGEFTVQGAATTATSPNLQPGTWCARAFHTNTYGSESGPSNVAVKVIAAPTPQPPSGFTFGS